MSAPKKAATLLTKSPPGEPQERPATERVLGCTVPRIFTPPLRELNEYTSYGYDVIEFADKVLGTPLDPWEQWLVIHMGELLEADPTEGLPERPRFRIALILVARQNGKTFLARVLTLYWLFVEKQPMILGLNTTIAYAKEQWVKVYTEAKLNPYLSAKLDNYSVFKSTGNESFRTIDGACYRPVAANRRAGRSLTVHRVINDELREQHNLDAWNAAYRAMNAVKDAQMVCISNQGDDESVVLDMLRDPAIEAIEGSVSLCDIEDGPSYNIGLFEWSAPVGSDPTSMKALAMANPDLNRRAIYGRDLVAEGRRAVKKGGLELASFQTEVMCIRVQLLNPAIDYEKWKHGAVAERNLAEYRDKLALCLDVSTDGKHAVMIGAVSINDVIYIETIDSWSGTNAVKELRDALPALASKVRPRVIGWLPNGPAAVFIADMKPDRSKKWPPRGVVLQEIKTEVPAACMALAGLIETDEICHFNDPMLNQQVKSAQKLQRGDVWVFTRRGRGPVNAVYAMAGAALLSRTLPPPKPALVVL